MLPVPLALQRVEGSDLSDEDINTPRSSESDVFELFPPYLIPRPEVFPTPSLRVAVISASNLKVQGLLSAPDCYLVLRETGMLAPRN